MERCCTTWGNSRARSRPTKPPSAGSRIPRKRKFNLGTTQAAQGHAEAAIRAFRAALQLRPNYAEAAVNLDLLFLKRSEPEAAISVYQAALQQAPASLPLLNNLGLALLQQGRLDAAIAAFRRALELHPDDAAMHSSLLFTLH